MSCVIRISDMQKLHIPQHFVTRDTNLTLLSTYLSCNEVLNGRSPQESKQFLTSSEKGTQAEHSSRF